MNKAKRTLIRLLTNDPFAEEHISWTSWAYLGLWVFEDDDVSSLDDRGSEKDPLRVGDEGGSDDNVLVVEGGGHRLSLAHPQLGREGGLEGVFDTGTHN